MSPRRKVAKRVWIVLSILWVLGWIGFAYVGMEGNVARLSREENWVPLLLVLVAPQGALIVAWFSWRNVVLPVTRWIIAPLDEDKSP